MYRSKFLLLLATTAILSGRCYCLNILIKIRQSHCSVISKPNFISWIHTFWKWAHPATTSHRFSMSPSLGERLKTPTESDFIAFKWIQIKLLTINSLEKESWLKILNWFQVQVCLKSLKVLTLSRNIGANLKRTSWIFEQWRKASALWNFWY